MLFLCCDLGKHLHPWRTAHVLFPHWTQASMIVLGLGCRFCPVLAQKNHNSKSLTVALNGRSIARVKPPKEMQDDATTRKISDRMPLCVRVFVPRAQVWLKGASLLLPDRSPTMACNASCSTYTSQRGLCQRLPLRWVCRAMVRPSAVGPRRFHAGVCAVAVTDVRVSLLSE
jgi:hypothetical protein